MTLFLALLLDWLVGDPDGLWKRIPHPVVLIGNGIDFLDRKLNMPEIGRSAARGRGVIALLVLLLVSLGAGFAIRELVYLSGILGPLLEVVIISVFIAQKSLKDHVMNVVTALRQSGVEGGRIAVSQIVGRNVATLGDSGVCRAAIESLAENFSDGVVAPVFWYSVFGLPGLIAYKAVNTADSMIGHMNVRYENFGRATALFDDVLNWLPARISALLIALASGAQGGVSRTAKVLEQVRADAATHRSPNAGWPETAMAASLGIALGGVRSYQGVKVAEPLLNAAGRAIANSKDISNALKIFNYSCIGLWVVVLLAYLFGS